MTSGPWISITGQSLDLDLPDGYLGKCTPVSAFEKLNRLGEGTYGVVSRARHRDTSEIVALKQVRIEPEERQNGIPITALREIAILRSLKHANIINITDVAVGSGDDSNGADTLDEVYMVMEYAEQDLANLLDEVRVKYTLSEIKCLFRQLLEGLEYLHKNSIIHRDVKMSNILLTSKGTLKLADFGMAREYADRPLTPGVVTIWYRAPELLLGTSRYTPAVDLWSAGLVLSELVICMPVLQGETELEQLALTVKLIGSPSPSDMSALVEMGCPMLSSWRREQLAHGRADNLERRFLPDTTKETVKILAGLLKWDPRARLTASEALGKGRSRFAAEAEKWWSESPRESRKELLPSFPEVRNGERSGKELAFRGDDPDQPTTAGIGKKHVGESGGYVFDFGDNSASRANKRHRPR